MLTAAQIVPFLEHQNHDVRELALRYLAEAHDPSPATADDLWRVMDQLGTAVHEQFLEVLSSMPQTESSVNRTLARLQTTTDKVDRDHLENALAELRYGLLVRFDDVIGASALSDELRNHLKERIQLASVPPRELWDRLAQHADEFEKAEQDSDPHIAQRLIEALSRNPEAAQWAIATLNDSSIKGMLEVWSVVLLGEIRFSQAAEMLLNKLTEDSKAEFLIEASTNALVKIGTNEVVRLIQQRFINVDTSFRYHMADVLRRIKLPFSETAAITLLSQESDPGVQILLGNALCDLACTKPEGLTQLSEMVTSGKWNRRDLPLNVDVAALFTMLGKPPPTPPKTAPMAMAFADAAREPAKPPPPQKTKPIRRSTAKVGRNDPCPCGSGKKYKKCCGK